MGFGWPRKNPCIWIPHFCGMTYRTDAIAIALKDGWERRGHSATYAESRKEGLRDGIWLASQKSLQLDTAFLRYDAWNGRYRHRFYGWARKKWMGEERSGGHSATYAESRKAGQ